MSISSASTIRVRQPVLSYMPDEYFFGGGGVIFVIVGASIASAVISLFLPLISLIQGLS